MSDKTIILHCREHCIEAIECSPDSTPDKTIARITTAPEAKKFFKEHKDVYCSSDMDFPEQYTKDRRLLKLVRSLRK